jgi:hypothetical protein
MRAVASGCGGRGGVCSPMALAWDVVARMTACSAAPSSCDRATKGGALQPPGLPAAYPLPWLPPPPPHAPPHPPWHAPPAATPQGMGEPLNNYEAVKVAVSLMTDPRAFGLRRRKVTVSTVGVIPRMLQMVDDMPGVRWGWRRHRCRAHAASCWLAGMAGSAAEQAALHAWPSHWQMCSMYCSRPLDARPCSPHAPPVAMQPGAVAARTHPGAAPGHRAQRQGLQAGQVGRCLRVAAGGGGGGRICSSPWPLSPSSPFMRAWPARLSPAKPPAQGHTHTKANLPPPFHPGQADGCGGCVPVAQQAERVC